MCKKDVLPRDRCCDTKSHRLAGIVYDTRAANVSVRSITHQQLVHKYNCRLLEARQDFELYAATEDSVHIQAKHKGCSTVLPLHVYTDSTIYCGRHLYVRRYPGQSLAKLCVYVTSVITELSEVSLTDTSLQVASKFRPGAG